MLERKNKLKQKSS